MLLLCACANSSSISSSDSAGSTNTLGKYSDIISNTYWYVPADYLKAYIYAQAASGTAFDIPVLDQTVWYLQTAKGPADGYFFGRSVARFYPITSPDGVTVPARYACNRIQGSITPSGNVYISFIPLSSDGNSATITTGLGHFARFKAVRNQWAFEMQMGSGTTSTLASHWAYMLPCGAKGSCFTSLPAANTSIPDFMAKCNW